MLDGEGILPMLAKVDRHLFIEGSNSSVQKLKPKRQEGKSPTCSPVSRLLYAHQLEISHRDDPGLTANNETDSIVLFGITYKESEFEPLEFLRQGNILKQSNAVSYTHLTLPTIYSV